MRALLINKFPFRIIYYVEDNNINIVSIFHTSKNPNTWQTRNNL